MAKTSQEIYEEKKKALADGDEALIIKVGQGKDIMSILSNLMLALSVGLEYSHCLSLVRANMSASKEESLTEEELLGQMT